MRCIYILSVLFWLLSATRLSHAFSWPHWGRCPNLEVEQNFSLSLYEGRWYEQAGYNTYSLEGDKRCVYANYFLNTTDNVFHVYNHGLDNKSNKWGGVNGTAALDDPSKEEAKLTVSFKIFSWWTVKGPYWVLGTDYNTYSVVYSCENFLLFFHYYTVWFLSREQSFPSTEEEQSFYNNTNKVLTNARLSASIMNKSNQTNCDF